MTRGPAARPKPSSSPPAKGPMVELLRSRDTQVGSLTVRRALPGRGRRQVGPWTFLDHFGPADLGDGAAVDVGPHPHIGLQTVTWLLSGEVIHKDSLGSHQRIRPGQLNLMTAGRGIAHSEEGVPGATGMIHGLQLWVALPGHAADTAPAFEHHDTLPTGRIGAADVTVLMGQLAGMRSPATTFSPMVGLEARIGRGAGAALPLDMDFEHAVLVVEGRAEVAGVALAPGTLAYLGRGRGDLTVRTDVGTRLMLVGGEPLGEELLLWWNFVGRSWEELAQARADWAEGAPRFPEVADYRGSRLPAPALPG